MSGRLLLGLALGAVAALTTVAVLAEQRGGAADPPPAAVPVPMGGGLQGAEPRAVDRQPVPAGEAAVALSSVIGRVVDGLGQPVEACEVAFQELHGSLAPAGAGGEVAGVRVATGADGRFRLRLPPDRAGVLVLSHADFPPRIARADLAMGPGEARSLGDLVLHSSPGVVVRVTSRVDQRPVPGARVTMIPAVLEVSLPTVARTLAERAAVTDATGKALLYGVAPGAYAIRIEAPQCATAEVSHLQPAAAARASEVPVEVAPGHVLRGRLEGAQGADLGVVTVRAEPVGGGVGLPGTVSASGDFRIAGAAEGRYRLTAESTRFGSLQADVDVPGPPVALRFARGGAISGIVLARAGLRPLPRARVLAEPESGWPLQRAGQSVMPSAFTDADGRFEIVGLPEGRFRIEAASDGFVPTRSNPVLTGTAELRLLLDAGLTVTGRVTVAEGDPAIGATVRLVDPDHQETAYARWKRAVVGSPPVEIQADERGGFTLAGIRPGSHRLAIEHAAGAPWLGEVLAGAPGSRVDLGEIRLAAGARVAGVALDDAGRPASGATVCLDGLSPGGAARSARADGAGRFEFTALSAGDYELSYHYPERDGPQASPGMRARTCRRVAVEPGSTLAVTLAPN